MLLGKAFSGYFSIVGGFGITLVTDLEEKA